MPTQDPTPEADPIELMFARAQNLRAAGVSHSQAMALAEIEMRLSQWPKAWGDDLKILVYGDFQPTPHDLDFPELGIRLGSTERKNTVIKGALAVVDATVTVDAKTIPAVLDAVRRINVLLGALTLTNWANAAFGWWCYITHSGGGGMIAKIDEAEVRAAVASIVRLPHKIRRKLDAALYWIRIGRPLVLETVKDGMLRTYVSYWNAFECLVDVVHLLRPRPKETRASKQAKIDGLLASGSTVTPEAIATLYRTVVDPGFTDRGTYALEVCFGEQAPRYIEECFRRPDKENQLYRVRNSINHGDVDAENLEELARVQDRLGRLGILILMMFGRIVAMKAPVDLPD
jgi:hypothetical protein